MLQTVLKVAKFPLNFLTRIVLSRPLLRKILKRFFEKFPFLKSVLKRTFFSASLTSFSIKPQIPTQMSERSKRIYQQLLKKR